MEDGLFFWLVIMAVAVLQGIGARKKKAGQQGQKPGMPGQKPGMPGQKPGMPRQKPPASGQRPRSPAASRPATADIPQGGGAETGGSSEGMIPSDVWAEILGLARGGPPVTEPEAEPEVERVPEPALAPAPRPFPTSHGASAVLHETKPAAFESRLAVSRSPESGSGAKKKRGVRAGLFGTGSPKELRKAIILQEVLGPPVGMREEGK